MVQTFNEMAWTEKGNLLRTEIVIRLISLHRPTGRMGTP
jgi:hypothetical protein